MQRPAAQIETSEFVQQLVGQSAPGMEVYQKLVERTCKGSKLSEEGTDHMEEHRTFREIKSKFSDEREARIEEGTERLRRELRILSEVQQEAGDTQEEPEGDTQEEQVEK